MIKNMVKLVLMGIILCATATHNVTGIRIDNHLISAKNDCFERIVLEAMIPFDRTFRTTDTNQIAICERLCIEEGDRCQTYSWGISVKGNGTCQLSSNKIDLSTGRRPAGTVYEPVFDIYQRKENCGIDTASSPPHPGGFGPNVEVGSTFPPLRPNTDRPTSPNFSTSSQTTPDRPISTTPNGVQTSLAVIPVSSNVPQNQDGISQRPSYYGPDQTTNHFPSTPSTRYPPENIYPSTERYPTKDRYPASKYPTESTYGTSNTYSTDDKYPKPTYSVNPYEDTFPPSPSTYPSESYPSFSTTNQDHFNFHHDIYPTYSYPMLYENHYPMPNDKDGLPNMYAQDIPTIETSYYSPGETYYQFKPMSSTRPPAMNGGNFYLPDPIYQRPPDRDRPTTTNYGNDGGRPNQMNSGYDPGRPNQEGYNGRPSQMGYDNESNRPMMGYDSNKPNQYLDRDKQENGYGTLPNMPYKPSSTPGYGNNKPEGNYQGTKEPIVTYFNPDDYAPKRKPGDVTGTGGNYGSMAPGVRPLEDIRPHGASTSDTC